MGTLKLNGIYRRLMATNRDQILPHPDRAMVPGNRLIPGQGQLVVRQSPKGQLAIDHQLQLAVLLVGVIGGQDHKTAGNHDSLTVLAGRHHGGFRGVRTNLWYSEHFGWDH